MHAVDPRDFQHIIAAYQLAKEKFDQFSPEEIFNLENYLGIKNEIRKNEFTYQRNRSRKKAAPIEYELVKAEYWNRGAGYDVHNLKVLKNNLKQEIIDLEELLKEPDRELDGLYQALGIFAAANLDVDFYEDFIKKYKKYVEEINFYSVFKLRELEEEKVFSIVSHSVSQTVSMKNFTLLSDESALGRSCLNRGVGEIFNYTDDDQSVRKFTVQSLRLMTKTEIEDLLQKRDRNLVVRNMDHGNNPFHLQDNYGANTSRYRKGG